MCSILFSTKDISDIEDINFYLKFRGPDHTEIKNINNCLFIHNLLSITGDFTIQPYHNDNIVLIYNGEIYNYKDFGDYKSDGECLIPLYKQYGPNFIKKLDGEFAICLVDFNTNQAIISSDIFKTKPLFLGIDDDKIGCSSYYTPLEKIGYKNIEKAKPNTIYTICLNTNKIINEDNVYEFDLNQHKVSYDGWIKAFENAIKKRIYNTDKNIFIGLSSGYDSGIIFSELVKNNHHFFSFSLLGTENERVILDRVARKNPEAECYTLNKNQEEYNNSHTLISQNTEQFYYTIHSSTSDYNEFNTLLINDGGANNFATICRASKNFNCKICLSGTGADEIISDYGFNGNKIYAHSNFGGMFPDDLTTIFPWASFYGSTLESYIAKEEYVGGSFGIEMRYPFLDKDLVQEFLWLHQDLKNKEYKAPIDYYFNENNFPYAKQEKRGF
jgi:asparagine synthetase B (glutamine-hydrolysing)